LGLKDIDDWSRPALIERCRQLALEAELARQRPARADVVLPRSTITSAEIPQLAQGSELDQRSFGLAPRGAALELERANPEAAVYLKVRLPRSTQHGGRLPKEISSS